MLNLNFDSFEKSSSTSLCKNYIFTDNKKPYLGTLFLILQIDIEKSKALKIAEILSEIIKLEYFKKKEKDISENFEFALSRANQAMTTLAEEGHIEWLNRLNALAVVIYDNQIHLSTTGKIIACLFRNNETINIVDTLTLQKPHPIMKTFVNIISGTLKNGDSLFFATSHVVDYFSWEKIKKVIQKQNINEIKNDFFSDLSLEEFEPMGFLVIKIGKKLSPSKEKFSHPLSIPSPSKTISFPQKSEQISQQSLSPPPLPPLPLITRENLVKINKNLKKIQNFIISLLNKIKFENLSKISKKFSSFKFDFNKEKNKGFLFNHTRILKNIFKVFSLKFQQLAPLSRTLLIIALLFIVALVVNVTKATINKKHKKLNLEAERILFLAKEKEKEASNALIYNDYKKAKEILLEAKILLDKDIFSSKKYKEEKENLLLKINKDLDETDKIIRLKEIKVLIDFEKEKIEPNEIIPIGNEIFIFNEKNGVVYKFIKKNKKILKFIQNDALKNTFLITPNETKNTILFLTKKPNLYELVIETKNLQILKISFPTNVTNFKDMKSYSERLYFLAPSLNQIFRHQRTISGYTEGSEWFLDIKNLDIKSATSFTIDGAIYILKSNGEILKFLNAKKEEFKIPELITPITAPTKITTNTESEFLYILEPKEKRIVVLNKKGGLKNQYLANEFSEIKDIYINEKDRKIYILSPRKLYEFTLEK